jgi:hypothetical protein
MSGISKKLMGTTAAGGGSTAIEDVFSTYLYTGNGSTQTITNGIDLAGEGGLVWSKWRGGVESHIILDSARNNGSSMINSDNNNAQGTAGNFIQSFNSNGYTMGSNSLFNGNTNTYASWTFRKAPRFFDVVTYTGTGVAGLEIAHNLGVAPGCVIVKRTNAGASWYVYHRGVDAVAPEDYVLLLDQTLARIDSSAPWNDTAPTDTVFTVGDNSNYNGSGDTYVAYLFAHDPLGPSGDGSDGLIACGSFTETASGFEVDLGWEPQFLIYKRTDGTAGWGMVDTMRGFTADRNIQYLTPNGSNAEQSLTKVGVTSTGFYSSAPIEVSGANFIYIAIRRGPMRAPESGTEVFAVEYHDATVAPAFKSPFPVDFALVRNVTATTSVEAASRLTQGKSLSTASTAAETSDASYLFDYQDGWRNTTGTFTNLYSWMFRRAPEFFDAVAATATSDTDQVLNHNLAATPELIIAKSRSAVGSWYVYYPTGGVSSYLVLNSTAASGTYSNIWGSTSPTETDFRINGPIYGVGNSIVAYLFATLAGVSKVGSYTGNQTNEHQIDCGFTTGARFVLAKKVSDTGDWYLFDSARGITTAYDPYLFLNNTDAEAAVDNIIRPFSGGFALGDGGQLNESGSTYIFYAIA